MLSRQNKIIILIISCVIVVALLIWFIMLPKSEVMRAGLKTETPKLPTADQVTVPVVPVPPKPPVQKAPEPDLSVTLKSIASAFAERYGSFSNQANFKNITDLFPLMTEDFKSRSENYIEKQSLLITENMEYYGVSSKTIKSNLDSINNEKTEAQVSLTLQKREAKGDMNSNIRVFYQKSIVKLKKIKEEWKIDSIESL